MRDSYGRGGARSERSAAEHRAGRADAPTDSSERRKTFVAPTPVTMTSTTHPVNKYSRSAMNLPSLENAETDRATSKVLT